MPESVPRLSHQLNEMFNTRESGYLFDPSHEACRAALAVRLLARLRRIRGKAPSFNANTERDVSRAEVKISRADFGPVATLEALDEWVAQLPLETADERLAVVRCLDESPAITRALARARVGRGTGAVSVTELMLELAEIRPGEAVLDPCFGAGELLSPVHAQARLTAFERHPGAFLIGLTRAVLLGHSHIDLRYDDALRLVFAVDGGVPRFDCVVLAPQFGQRLDPEMPLGEFLVRPSFGESAYLQVATRLLAPGGRVVMITTDGLLFRQKSDAALRQHLRSDFDVECVVSLPDDAFPTSAQIKTSLLVLRRLRPRSSVYFARCLPETLPSGRWSAKSFVTALRQRRLDPESFIDVPWHEIERRGDVWLVDQALLMRDIEAEISLENHELYPTAPIVPLGEVAKVFSGTTPKGKQKVMSSPPPANALGLLALTQIRGGKLSAPKLFVTPEFARTLSSKAYGRVTSSWRSRPGPGRRCCCARITPTSAPVMR